MFALVIIGYAYSTLPNFNPQQPPGPQLVSSVSAIDSSTRFKTQAECAAAASALTTNSRGLMARCIVVAP